MSKYRTPEQRIVGGMLHGIAAVFKWVFGRAGKRVGRRGISIDRVMVGERWQEIKILVQQGGASRLRSAVVEADKLLDYALRGRGFPGQTMGERLKSARNAFSHEGYDAAWRGHKLRNRLVHELEADVTHWEVNEGLVNFERALRELGVL